MIEIPSIVLIAWLAMFSCLGALILSKPWMKFTALGLAAMEIGIVIFLVVVARS